MATNETQDPRSTDMKVEMAKHFEMYEAEYRTEPEHHEVVFEDDEKIIVADHTGHELNGWVSQFDITREDLSTFFHGVARELTDYDWSVSDPVVIDKMDD